MGHRSLGGNIGGFGVVGALDVVRVDVRLRAWQVDAAVLVGQEAAVAVAALAARHVALLLQVERHLPKFLVQFRHPCHLFKQINVVNININPHLFIFNMICII